MNKSPSITYSPPIPSTVGVRFSSGSLGSRQTRFPCLQSCWTAEWLQAILVSAHPHTHKLVKTLLNLQTDIQGHKLSCDTALFIRENNRMSPGEASEFCKTLRHVRRCYPSREQPWMTSADACQQEWFWLCTVKKLTCLLEKGYYAISHFCPWILPGELL